MNELVEDIVRLPRKQDDPTMVSPWRNNTEFRRSLLRLCDLMPALLTIEKILGDDGVTAVDWNCRWSFEKPYVEITCPNEGAARKIVGHLIRSFKIKSKVKKISDDQMQAIFELDGCEVRVAGYKPKTCRYEEVEIKVPAQRRRIEKKVIPAQKARVEKRRILVCDDVKTEPQIQEEVASVNLTSEVPF